MPIDDEQLDALLRDVRVPRGLQQSLQRIPSQTPEVAGNTEVAGNVEVAGNAKPRNPLAAWAGACTAIAAAVSVLIYFAPVPVAIRDNLNLGNTNRKSVEALLAQMEHNLDEINQIQIAQDLDSKRDARWKTAPAVDLRESVAMAMSLSWESSLDFGTSTESIEAELEYVIDKFPETRGAQRARRLLQSN